MKTPAEELGHALAKDLGSMSDKAQADVAKELGVSQQTVSNWMTGKHLPRAPKLVKLHGVFGSDTNTGKALEHIAPRIFMSHNYDRENLALIDHLTNQLRETYSEQVKGDKLPLYKGGMRKLRSEEVGRLSSGPSSPPPPMDTDEPQSHSNHQVSQTSAPYGIASFEQQSAGEMHEALSRAAKGVDLARQVLDDASVQLAKAMQQLQKA